MTTSRAFLPVPRNVGLTVDAHAELVETMVLGRDSSDPATAAAGSRALNTLAGAYFHWTKREATRRAVTAESAEDRAAEAQIRVLQALTRYDPASGVPLSAFLIANNVVRGEAVAAAGMPMDLVSRKDRREHIKSGAQLPRPVSFETPAGEDRTLGDTIVDTAQSPEAAGEAAELTTALASALASIDPDQAESFRRYYGYEGSEPETLAAIAASVGVVHTTIASRVKAAKAALAVELAAYRAGA